jgi:hypothetical protein
MKRFLDRHKSEVFGVIVAPQENLRLEVPRCYLEEYLTLIKKIVPIVPTELLFDLDATGLSDGRIKEVSQSLFQPKNKNLHCIVQSIDP